MRAPAIRTEVPASAVADFSPDYSDCFQVPADPAGHSAAEWARATLRGADGAFSRVVWQGILGFALTSGAPETLVGWPIAQDSPARFVLQTDGRLMAGRMVFDLDDEVLRWTTTLRFHGSIGAAVWTAVGPGHRRLAPRSLDHARPDLARISPAR